MTLKAKPIIAGLTVLIPCDLLIYYLEPWVENHTTFEHWQGSEISPALIALWSLILISSLVAYVSARVAKEREWLYGGFWCISMLLFFLFSELFLPTLSSRRFPIPSFRMGWWWFVLVGLYCGMIMGGAAHAEIANKKEKPDPDLAEVAGEVASEGIEVIHELFKHH